jgi:hypothetical protein
MSAESLLLWMSARVQGSWAQFRAAVEELHLEESEDGETDASDEESVLERGLPLYHILRLNLQRLGHAEFFAGAAGSDWRIAPPCLAITPLDQSWLGVLAGARSARLLDRISSAAPNELQVREFPACPNQIMIPAGDVQTLRDLAQRAGLLIQEAAPAALLSCIPRIDELGIRSQAQVPFGPQWRAERFSASSLSWKGAAVQEAGAAAFGLFRFSRHFERSVLLCTRRGAYAVPAQVGKYLVLKARRRWVLRYDVDSHRLSVPASCRPPFLLERALILCSGIPPHYEARNAQSGVLHYADIPAPIARLASALLCQELR